MSCLNILSIRAAFDGDTAWLACDNIFRDMLFTKVCSFIMQMACNKRHVITAKQKLGKYLKTLNNCELTFDIEH